MNRGRMRAAYVMTGVIGTLAGVLVAAPVGAQASGSAASVPSPSVEIIDATGPLSAAQLNQLETDLAHAGQPVLVRTTAAASPSSPITQQTVAAMRQATSGRGYTVVVARSEPGSDGSGGLAALLYLFATHRFVEPSAALSPGPDHAVWKDAVTDCGDLCARLARGETVGDLTRLSKLPGTQLRSVGDLQGALGIATPDVSALWLDLGKGAGPLRSIATPTGSSGIGTRRRVIELAVAALAGALLVLIAWRVRRPRAPRAVPDREATGVRGEAGVPRIRVDVPVPRGGELRSARIDRRKVGKRLAEGIVRTELRPDGYVEIERCLRRARWADERADPPAPGETVVVASHDGALYAFESSF